MPEGYAENVQIAEHYTKLHSLPAHVWPGLTFNRQAATQIHNDGGDAYVGIAWKMEGEEKGGDWTFPQLKLRIEAFGPQFMPFWTALLAHGNSPITGPARKSIVLHSDKSAYLAMKRSEAAWQAREDAAVEGEDGAEGDVNV